MTPERAAADAALMAEATSGDFDREIVATIGLFLVDAADSRDPHASLTDFLAGGQWDYHEIAAFAQIIADHYVHALPSTSLTALQILRGLMGTTPDRRRR